MEWIGVLGIVVGLVFFVIAAMRGWNVLITSIVTAIVIALTNGMDIMNSMVGTETSYVTGLEGFIRGNLLIFMGGAIMGEFMDKIFLRKLSPRFVQDDLEGRIQITVNIILVAVPNTAASQEPFSFFDIDHSILPGPVINVPE